MRFYVELLRKGPDFFIDANGCELSKVTAPVALWIGDQDVVIDHTKTMRLLSNKTSLTYTKVLKGYGHTDSWYSKASMKDLTPSIEAYIKNL